MDAVQVVALWAHTLAFVIGWGYYGILGRIVLPAAERSLDEPARVTFLVALERRALPFLGMAVVLFTPTGSYLLVIDPEYEGLGAIRGSTWATLMLLKHLLVVAMVGLAVALDLLVRRLAEDEPDVPRALRRIRLTAEAATAMGALIALLTAAAQVA